MTLCPARRCAGDVVGVAANPHDRFAKATAAPRAHRRALLRAPRRAAAQGEALA